MNHPFDVNSFKFYLKFQDLNDVWYQISEPIGFDGVAFSKEQESGKYNRSIEYLDIDKLEFPDAQTILSVTEQVIDPYGNTSNHLDFGLHWWLRAFELKGFEAVVLFKVTKDNIDFRLFQADLKGDELSDFRTYVQCGFIDNTKVANFKRTKESKFNVFADKDWNGNTITPITTFNYLRRATSFQEKSLLNQPANFNVNVVQFGGDAHVFQPCLNIAESEIPTTLTSFLEIEYLPDTGDVNQSKQLIQDRTVIRARKRISNLVVDITDVNLSFLTTGFFTRNQLVVAYGNTPIDDWTPIQLFESTNTSFNLTNQSYQVVIPNLEIGQRVWIYFSSTNGNPIQNPTPLSSVSLNINNAIKISLKANTLALDQVISVFRWIDFIKQASKFNQNIPVNASLFDVGGKHYQNAIYNKRMMTRRTDFLYTTPKEVFESLQEVNCDAEIDNDEIFIGHETDFYKDVEIGVFEEIPQENQNISYNDKSMINKMTYEYNYEKDRNTIGTSKSVHNLIELRILNEKENYIGIKNKLIRDPLAKQKAFDLELRQPTTETDDDNNIFIENMVELAPNSFGNLKAFLAMRVVAGNLEILNIDSLGDAQEIPFNWFSLGLGVGLSVSIIAGVNIGTYSVLFISEDGNLIRLQPTIGVPTFSGDGFINMQYFYTGVAFQTRTNQGFSLIENVSDTFSDLAYTPKRNIINYFSEKLGNVLMYAQKNIVVAQPPINEDCTTQLTTESVPVIEKADITYSSLATPLITGRTINSSMVGNYGDVVAYLQAYKVNRGYISIIVNNDKVVKVFPKNFKYFLSENRIELKNAEEKFEPITLTITGTIGNLYVSGSPRRIDWWRFQNDFLQVFDEKSRPLSSKYEYNLVILNGVTYNSADELATALMLLN